MGLLRVFWVGKFSLDSMVQYNSHHRTDRLTISITQLNTYLTRLLTSSLNTEYAHGHHLSRYMEMGHCWMIVQPFAPHIVQGLWVEDRFICDHWLYNFAVMHWQRSVIAFWHREAIHIDSSWVPARMGILSLPQSSPSLCPHERCNWSPSRNYAHMDIWHVSNGSIGFRSAFRIGVLRL